MVYTIKTIELLPLLREWTEHWLQHTLELGEKFVPDLRQIHRSYFDI